MNKFQRILASGAKRNKFSRKPESLCFCFPLILDHGQWTLLFSEDSVADRPHLPTLNNTAAIQGNKDDKETCPRLVYSLLP